MINKNRDSDSDLPTETPLYRYLSTEAFIYLVYFRRLTIPKMSEWPDSYEGERFAFLKRARKEASFSDMKSGDFFISCWTLQTEDSRLYESDALLNSAQIELEKDGSASMWESYCKNGGVRIKTSIGKMRSLLRSVIPDWTVFDAPVYYEPTDRWEETMEAQSLPYTLMHKRVSFRCESEYRFVLLPRVPQEKSRFYLEIVDPCDFLDEILISPATPSKVWFSRTLYNIAANLKSDRHSTNMKNGERFARISQLYTSVSEVVGHHDMEP